MPQLNGAELKRALLEARSGNPQVQAALGPVELLERQLGDFVDAATSVGAAYAVAVGITEKHPGASTPFLEDAAAAGFARADRAWAARLLLGAELRRGLLTYRIAGLTPRSSEADLAAALGRRLDSETREGLLSLQTWMQSRGRGVAQSDLYLTAWGEGLSIASRDPARAAEVLQPDDDRFIRLVMSWGWARAELARARRDGTAHQSQ